MCFVRGHSNVSIQIHQQNYAKPGAFIAKCVGKSNSLILFNYVLV